TQNFKPDGEPHWRLLPEADFSSSPQALKHETRLDHPTEIRRRVTAFLALLSSAPAHERLTTKMEPEQLAFELLRIWFDDVYLPSARYVDGLKGDYSATAADVFRSAFSDEECADLERFHRFVELR